MRAAWYDRQGPADEVLQLGELPEPEAGPGEVRVRMRYSGINPGDTKKRRGWLGSSMPYPRVVPHSDGSGTVDQVGHGVDPGRRGQRVWVYGAQSYRASGTAAQLCVVPADLAVPLPDSVPDDLGGCLGIPGITAHQAVFADGPVAGKTVLVQGVLGSVSSLAAQLAGWGGATVVGTVRRGAEIAHVTHPAITSCIALDEDDVAGAIRRAAPDGVDRIVEVAFSDNVELDAAIAGNDTVIAAFATRDGQPRIPFWPLLFNNVTIRLLGSDDFSPEAKRQAAHDLTAAAAQGALSVDIRTPLPLEEVAAAHDAVDAGGRGRVVLAIPGQD